MNPQAIKPSLRRALSLLLLGVLLWGIPTSAAAQPPVVVATFSVIGDLVQQVTGPENPVRVLAPRGAEVHEWELSPRNFVDLEQAHIVFANGFNLEQWIPQIQAVVRRNTPIVRLAEQSGYPTLPIATGEMAGDPDPHMWMDPRGAAAMVAAARDALIAVDPARADTYRRNAADYLARLDALHGELTAAFSAIPPDRRVMLTSEAAFVYFAAAYGFDHDGIWGTNSESEGTPQQLMRIIDIIAQKRPAALFWESTISDRYVQSVAAETRTPIAGPLYVDSLTPPGSPADTYLGLMRANARLLVETLGD